MIRLTRWFVQLYKGPSSLPLHRSFSPRNTRQGPKPNAILEPRCQTVLPTDTIKETPRSLQMVEHSETALTEGVDSLEDYLSQDDITLKDVLDLDCRGMQSFDLFNTLASLAVLYRYQERNQVDLKMLHLDARFQLLVGRTMLTSNHITRKMVVRLCRYLFFLGLLGTENGHKEDPTISRVLVHLLTQHVNDMTTTELLSITYNTHYVTSTSCDLLRDCLWIHLSHRLEEVIKSDEILSEVTLLRVLGSRMTPEERQFLFDKVLTKISENSNILGVRKSGYLLDAMLALNSCQPLIVSQAIYFINCKLSGLAAHGKRYYVWWLSETMDRVAKVCVRFDIHHLMWDDVDCWKNIMQWEEYYMKWGDTKGLNASVFLRATRSLALMGHCPLKLFKLTLSKCDGDDLLKSQCESLAFLQPHLTALRPPKVDEHVMDLLPTPDWKVYLQVADGKEVTSDSKLWQEYVAMKSKDVNDLREEIMDIFPEYNSVTFKQMSPIFCDVIFENGTINDTSSQSACIILEYDRDTYVPGPIRGLKEFLNSSSEKEYPPIIFFNVSEWKKSKPSDRVEYCRQFFSDIFGDENKESTV